MTWRLRIAPAAVKQLAKLDRPTAKLITAWLRKNVDGCDDPRAHGKPLVGTLAGSWRYRIGDYRILCEIRDSELIVLALEVSHRRDVYGKKTKERKQR